MHTSNAIQQARTEHAAELSKFFGKPASELTEEQVQTWLAQQRPAEAAPKPATPPPTDPTARRRTP